MTCPTCRRAIPVPLLACPGCVEDRSRAAMRLYQLHPLRKVHAGLADLTVRTMAGDSRHLQMFGAEQTFCGLEISPQHRTRRIPWEATGLSRICGACTRELNLLMEEACRSV